jgi:putative membrane protein
MDEPIKTKPAPDLREILAAERTFLAWIRTGLALMGFGFVVARFGIFLREVQVAGLVPTAPALGDSIWFGTALIALGVVVNLLSALHHIHLTRMLDRGEIVPSRPSTLAVSIALFLALVGLAMAIYLISIRGSEKNHPGKNVSASMAPAASTWGCDTV